VLLLAFLDSAGVPIPGGVDALVITVAALDPSSAIICAVLATLGSLAGNIVLFHLARKGGQKYLDKYTHRGRGELFRRWFLRYGLVTVFIPALLPIPMPMKVFVLCAGALGIRFVTFFVVLVLARVPRFFALAYLGAKLGENSASYLKQHAWELIGIAVALFVFLILLVRISERWRRPVPANDVREAEAWNPRS
jgi:membrane protein YqaA with SNARE-associated domain